VISDYDLDWLTRIFAKTEERASGCWIWVGSQHKSGYVYRYYRGRSVKVHRKIFELTMNLTLSPKECVCHSCDIPQCINPDHLWVGSHQQNIRDASSKGRLWQQQVTHCPRGHAYTPENTRISKAGLRNCRACARIRTRIRRGMAIREAEYAGNFRHADNGEAK
jgi:hypothetical protein